MDNFYVVGKIRFIQLNVKSKVFFIYLINLYFQKLEFLIIIHRDSLNQIISFKLKILMINCIIQNHGSLLKLNIQL